VGMIGNEVGMKGILKMEDDRYQIRDDRCQRLKILDVRLKIEG